MLQWVRNPAFAQRRHDTARHLHVGADAILSAGMLTDHAGGVELQPVTSGAKRPAKRVRIRQAPRNAGLCRWGTAYASGTSSQARLFGEPLTPHKSEGPHRAALRTALPGRPWNQAPMPLPLAFSINSFCPTVVWLAVGSCPYRMLACPSVIPALAGEIDATPFVACVNTVRRKYSC